MSTTKNIVRVSNVKVGADLMNVRFVERFVGKTQKHVITASARGMARIRLVENEKGRFEVVSRDGSVDIADRTFRSGSRAFTAAVKTFWAN